MSREHLGQFAIGRNMGFTRGILLLDDCEGTLAWSKAGNAGDYTLVYDTGAAFIGTNGLHLSTRATNPADDDYAKAYRYMEWTESGLIVIRSRFASPDISDVKEITVIVAKDDESDVNQAAVQWLNDGDTVKYQTGALSWVDSGIDSGVVGDLQWNSFELVVDLTLKKWVSLRMFGQYADLSDADMWWNEGGGAVKSVLLDIMVRANSANMAELYLDQIYVGEHVDL